VSYYLKYAVGGINFATPIEEIREIARPDEIIEKKMAKNIDGFFNLREKKALIYDLAKFLEIETTDKFEVIVAEIDGKYIGFRVTKVFGIIEAEDLKPFPEIVKAKSYFKGVIKERDTLVQVLSFEKLLSGNRLKAIKKYLEDNKE